MSSKCFIKRNYGISVEEAQRLLMVIEKADRESKYSGRKVVKINKNILFDFVRQSDAESA